jgi:hypothetical protein
VDDFLRFFAFRTGLPCGYLLFFAVGFSISVTALVAVVAGLRLKPPGAVVLACAAVWVCGNVAYDLALDLNPMTDAESVSGVWRWNGATLQLHSNGAYELDPGSAPLHSGRSVGHWTLDGLELHLIDNRGQSALDLRPITFRGRLHLMVDPHEDPDSWDGDLGFSRP